MHVTQIKNQPIEVINQFVDGLSPDEYKILMYDWQFWARPEQLPPQELFTDESKFQWLYLAGRGAGKTRSMAEFVTDCVKNRGYRRISLIGATAPEVRTIIMEGESGLLNISHPDFMPVYEPSKKKVIWPNGAIANIFYGSEPELSRGAQSDLVWMDELCKWQYPQETVDNIMFGLRLGKKPLCCISTTPKPIKAIKDLLKDTSVCVTRGTTYDNKDNLANSFIKTIIGKYEGTRLGRQELNAEILEDNPGALWKRAWIDRDRISTAPDMERIVVAIDPKAMSDADSEAGIIVAGKGVDGFYYMLEDCSMNGGPLEWAQTAINAYERWRADRIVAEINNGGEMVESTLKNIKSTVPYKSVWASRGKVIRAEPISALSEQGKIKHVGVFANLEDQLCEWEQGMKSPDRLDAYVWAFTFLADILPPTKAPDTIKQGLHTKSRSKIEKFSY